MAEILWNLPWLVHNAQRAYPIAEWATQRDISGTFTLPNDFLVGCYIPVNPALNVQPDRFFVQELLVASTGYRITVAYDDAGTISVLGSASFAKDDHQENSYYYLVGSGQFEDTTGIVVIGSLQGIEQAPPGVYQFTLSGAALEVDCIRPMLRGVQSFQVDNGTDVSPRLYGDIVLRAGRNFRLTASQNGDTVEITLDAIEGEGLNVDCACSETEQSPCIRTIGGVPPDGSGNVSIVGTDCVQVSASGSQLNFSNPCSQPCYGCEELQALRDQLQRFADGVNTLEEFVNRLNSEVTQFHQVVLGSKLADQGCQQC